MRTPVDRTVDEKSPDEDRDPAAWWMTPLLFVLVLTFGVAFVLGGLWVLNYSFERDAQGNVVGVNRSIIPALLMICVVGGS